ncbi:histidine kinase [Bacteroidales bacterium OttesenSCG-928-A17]|nr:histidine kinase [Bacteroidales bacterium OttesenSCG-928-A17]
MNNERKNKNERKGIPIIIHILFCVAILAIPLLIMARYGLTEFHPYMGYLIRAGILIFLFYVNYLFLIDRLLLKRKFALYAIINILLIVSIVFLQNLLFELLWGPPRRIENKDNNFPEAIHTMRVLGDYVFNILAIGLSVGLKATQRWYTDFINLETIKAAQLEADLKNLRSQLNPHFLFNTLNNIYSLIAIDSGKAQESIHRLSSLLRYILYENEQKFVPIDKELEFTQNYINLMQLRLSSDVELSVEIDNGNCDKQVASLLFMTLIENAFKHGIKNGSNSFINIKIDVDQKGVLCTVENSFEREASDLEPKNSGIGLPNLQKRLDLLYPGKHKLVIERREKNFFVLLYTEF